jgi:hypothetical protein
MNAASLSAGQCTIFGANPTLAVAAIAGAYMFAVGDAVNSVRQNTLNVADVYWYALRLVIAIPLGVAAGGVAQTNTAEAHTLVAFGLGALPIDEIQKLLRRLTSGQFVTGDARQETDQLLSLEGVTTRTSSLLVAEGINSVSQLESKDPVLLAVRTGLEFDFVLYLSSQSIVRRHLGGGAAAALVPLGLIEAQSIYNLMHRLNQSKDDSCAEAHQMLSDAASVVSALIPLDHSASQSELREASIQLTFERIAHEPTTRFLVHIAPHGHGALHHGNAGLSDTPADSPPSPN